MVSRKKKKKSKLSSVSATAGQLAKGEKADKVEKGEKDTEEYNDLRTPAQRKFDEVQAERVRRLSFYCDIISLPHNLPFNSRPSIPLWHCNGSRVCMVAWLHLAAGVAGRRGMVVCVCVCVFFLFYFPPFPPVLSLQTFFASHSNLPCRRKEG